MFYIKEVTKSRSTSYPIFYYDLDNDKKGKLGTNTTFNKNISISPDGQFLAFNYKSSTNKEINCFEEGKCCDSSKGTKVGILELIIE